MNTPNSFQPPPWLHIVYSTPPNSWNPLNERVKDKGVAIEDWEEPQNYRLIRHKLLYAAGFSEGKLKFAIGKAHAQFLGRKYLGRVGYGVLGKPFERLTDFTFERMHWTVFKGKHLISKVNIKVKLD